MISNNLHQTSHLTTNQLNAASVTASTPLLMGGEHSAFRSLVPSASALLAASAQLGLTRPYNHSPHTMSGDESDEEINVHDDESDDDSNYNPRNKNNNEVTANKNSNSNNSIPA